MRTTSLLAMMMLAACDPVATSEHASTPESVSAGAHFGTEKNSGGGTSTQVATRDEPPRGTPEQAAHVKVIFSGTPINEPTEVLGVVDVHEPATSDQQGLEIMRERAAAMHADAVVGVEFHRDDKSFTDLSGLAVRYNDLLRGRTYDVLQVIRVHEGEGKDGDAMGELKRRAKALNADLVIDVEWHDNDAEKDGTYLSGTAIQYHH